MKGVCMATAPDVNRAPGPKKEAVSFGTVLVAVSVLAGSIYLGMKEYAKTTPLGAASFQAEMQKHVVLSNNAVQIERLRVRALELENEQIKLEKGQ